MSKDVDVVPGLGWPAAVATDSIAAGTTPAPVGWQDPSDVPRETSTQEAPTP